MFTKILVPLDGSECSAQALDLAIKVARAEDASLHLLHAIDPTAAAISDIDPTGTAIAPWLCRQHDEAKALLANAQEQAKAKGLHVTTELVEGEPVESILDALDRNTCDLIVIGCHGRKGLVRAIVGSVSEGVMRGARVPTMIAHATLNARVHARS